MSKPLEITKQQLIDLKAKGLNVTQMAEALRTTRSTVYRYLAIYGFIEMKRPLRCLSMYSDAFKETLGKLIETRATTGEIAQKLDISVPTVRKYIRIHFPEMCEAYSFKGVCASPEFLKNARRHLQAILTGRESVDVRLTYAAELDFLISCMEYGLIDLHELDKDRCFKIVKKNL